MTSNCICDNMIVSLIVAIFNKGTDLVNRVIKPSSRSSISSSSSSIRMMMIVIVKPLAIFWI